MNEPVRLAKRVAELQGCSRREAELYITGGWVSVNGVVVEEPQSRVAGDHVEVSKDASLLGAACATLLLHKPAGQPADLATATPAADERSVQRLLRRQLAAARLVTPLALPASGLVVFTDDWRIARKLREDAATMEHEVIVEVTGEIKPGGIERLNRIDHRFTFNGMALPPSKVSWQSEARLRFALKGEKPGQIAYLCESVGLTVVAMKRIRIGRVPLSGLQPGHWRHLGAHERF